MTQMPNFIRGIVSSIIIIIIIIIGVFVPISMMFYNGGYKNGQVDYQKGIIKYEIIECTTDIIKRKDN